MLVGSNEVAVEDCWTDALAARGLEGITAGLARMRARPRPYGTRRAAGIHVGMSPDCSMLRLGLGV